MILFKYSKDIHGLLVRNLGEVRAFFLLLDVSVFLLALFFAAAPYKAS